MTTEIHEGFFPKINFSIFITTPNNRQVSSYSSHHFKARARSIADACPVRAMMRNATLLKSSDFESDA